MEAQEDVEFVCEMRFKENDPLWSKIQQRVANRVEVKQEITADDETRPLDARPHSEVPISKKITAKPKKLTSEETRRRCCSRIQKIDSVKPNRHLLRRAQPIGVSEQDLGPPPAEDMEVSSGQEAPQQVPDNRAPVAHSSKSIVWIPTDSMISRELSQPGSNAMANPSFSQAILSNDSQMHCSTSDQSMGSMAALAGESQIRIVGLTGTNNVFEEVLSKQHQPITARSAQNDKSIRQSIKNELWMQPTEVVIGYPDINSAIKKEIAKNCAVCLREFQTHKNLERHLLTKLHAKNLKRKKRELKFFVLQ